MIKSTIQKNEELELGLSTLHAEISELCIDSDTRDKIIENYRTMKSCYNKRIFVNNIDNSNIRVNNNISLLDKGNLVNIYEGIQIDSSIYFYECNNSTILIYSKVNHITLEKCKNLDIKVIGGAITGIDNINSTNINYVFDDNDIYFIDMSGSCNCNIYLTERVAQNTLIITMYSLFINIIILDQYKNIKKVFKKNDNYLNTIGNYKYNLITKLLENI